jgi:hypothetical protein
MPPTIIVTVGRAAVELAEAELLPPAVAPAPALVVPPAGDEEVLLPDEQAATVSAVHAAARAAREPLVRPILRIGATPLLRFEGKEMRDS